MIKMSQSAREKLDSYCKIFNPTMPYKQALCTFILINFSDSNHYCAGPENIYTHPTEGIGISRGGRVL